MRAIPSIGAGVVVACALFLCGTASGQPFTSFETYYTFANSQGSYPFGPLVEGPDGSLYGTTYLGGLKTCSASVPAGCGTVYRITPDGRRTVLHVFSGPEGAFPEAGLTWGIDGNLYGVTSAGGTLVQPDHVNGRGTVFRITPSGVLTIVHLFAGGGGPRASLLRSADGTLYGTSYDTIFKIATDGTFTTLYRFSTAGPGPAGSGPTGPLVMDADGNLYGLTRLGGTGVCHPFDQDIGCGTVFRMTPSGLVTTIHSFAPLLDGTLPEPLDLIFDAADNSLLGTIGVPAGCGSPDPDAHCRALFRLTLTGTLTTPVFNVFGYSLVLSSDGNIYGLRGSNVFRLTPDGEQTTLHDFTATDPNGSGLSLIQSASGDLLGTSFGGPKCFDPAGLCGGVFRLGLFDVADAPDLSIRSFKTPRRVAVGATVTLTASTANLGTAAATPSVTTFWLSSTGSLAGAQLLAVNPVAAIPAGLRVTHSRTVALPPVAPGLYYFIALADRANVVHEAYEANNASRQPLVIGPDLTIKQIFPPGPGLSIDPPQPTSTAPTDVSIHTANIGGEVVGPSTTYLYASPRRKLDTHAVLLATIPNVPMKPNEHNHVFVSVTLPAGNYYLVAVADANGAIEEANEGNNERALFVTVQ